MKVKSKWIIHALKWLLNIIWYLNFVFLIGSIYFLAKEYIVDDTYYFNERVTINMHKALQEQEHITGSELVSNARLFKNQGRVMIDIKNSPLHTLISFVGFLSAGILIIGILFYLRRIFSNFQKGVTFSLEIVKHFKIIALLIVLYSVLDWVIYLYKDWVLAQNMDNYGSSFSLDWYPNFEGLIAAAIIFAMANIFKFGFELEQENKEFV